MGGWVELYPIFFWIFGIFLTLQSPLAISNALLRFKIVANIDLEHRSPLVQSSWAHSPQSVQLTHFSPACCCQTARHKLSTDILFFCVFLSFSRFHFFLRNERSRHLTAGGSFQLRGFRFNSILYRGVG